MSLMKVFLNSIYLRPQPFGVFGVWIFCSENKARGGRRGTWGARGVGAARGPIPFVGVQYSKNGVRVILTFPNLFSVLAHASFPHLLSQDMCLMACRLLFVWLFLLSPSIIYQLTFLYSSCFFIALLFSRQKNQS